MVQLGEATGGFREPRDGESADELTRENTVLTKSQKKK